MNYFAPFDTETGGLDENTADVLTFYMCIIDEDFKFQEGLYLKLKPNDGRLPVAEAGALRVNGIDLKAHLEDPDTITYAEARVKIIEMVKKYLKRRGRFSNIRPLGYNVPFDMRWVLKHILTPKDWEDLFHYQFVDVMQNVNFLKDSGWFPKDLGKLTTVAEYMQVPKRMAHNAQEDTLMTVDVHVKIVDLMKSKQSGGQTQDLISLLEAE